MSLSVQDRVRAIATFRFIEVRLMETVAGWTPLTPEMEVKVMLGRHIWDFAQHADLLGKRTFELRQPEQYTLPATPDYVSLLADVASETTTFSRLGSLYDAVLPALERRYQAYVADSDAIVDGPSLVIIERILNDIPRMRSEADEVRRRLSIARVSIDDLVAREAGIRSLVAAI
jgi:hypothetical protein